MCFYDIFQLTSSFLTVFSGPNVLFRIFSIFHKKIREKIKPLREFKLFWSKTPQYITIFIGKLKIRINFSNFFHFFWYLIIFKKSFLYFINIKMKHFETKFASTDYKVNFLNLKKIKIFF